MTDQKQRKWPAFVTLWDSADEPFAAVDHGDFITVDGELVGPVWDEAAADDAPIYVRVESYRYWQHVRDTLDGTPEQWAEREQAAYERGWLEALLANGLPTKNVRDYGVAP